MNIPKSLHTVTVLVAFARALLGSPSHNAYTADGAIRAAIVALGYGATPDTYGLAVRAHCLLNKQLIAAATVRS